MVLAALRVLLIPLLILLARQSAWAEPVQAPGPQTSPAPAQALAPEQAQRLADLLRDDKARAELLQTLDALAGLPRAAPGVPAKPAPQGPAPLPPNSLGGQVLAQVTAWTENLSQEVAAATHAMTQFPLLGAWLDRMVYDPDARHALLVGTGHLALILACALLAEWLGRQALAGVVRALEAYAASRAVRRESVGSASADSRRSWHLLKRLPLALVRLVLDLLPTAVFAAIGNLLPGAAIGMDPMARTIILIAVNAYVVFRILLSVARLLVSPASAHLRLVNVGDQTAVYVLRWVRRMSVVAVFGGALAHMALLLGLEVPAVEAFLKVIALIVHLCLVVIVLQSRHAVAARIRARSSSHGLIALLRNRIAAVWHAVAVFFILALWVIWAMQVENGFVRLLRFFAVTAVILIVARLLAISVLGALDRAFQIEPRLEERYPGLQARLDRYHPIMRRAVSALAWALTLLALLEAWGMHVMAWFRDGRLGGRLLSASVTVALAALVALALWEAVNVAIDRHLARLTRQEQLSRAARLRTVLPILRTVLMVVILVIVVLTALSEVGVNIAPLLAGAGIVGVAIGFGSQKLVQDLITGLFLLLENAMQVGDTVTASGLSGVVEQLSIRTVRLRAGDGSVHIIPFSAVTSVTNANKGIGNAAVSVDVAYREETDRVGDTLKAIAAEMRTDPAFADLILGDLALWGVDKVSGSVVTVLGQIPCLDTGRWAVQREFNRRMKKRFQELGIEIANPTQAVVVQGALPAAGDAKRETRPDSGDGRAGPAEEAGFEPGAAPQVP